MSDRKCDQIGCDRIRTDRICGDIIKNGVHPVSFQIWLYICKLDVTQLND